MSERPIAIDVRDVVKTYDDGRTRALDGATMQVVRGEFIALTGPSGCGKSTLLHAIAALEKPDSGSIVVNGEDITKKRDLSAYRARTIGLIFQLHNLLPNLTALENVQVPMYEGSYPGRERSKRAHHLLELVELDDKANKRPAQLSGGERQRVAIARALANEPPIILADEPTGSLDSKAGSHVLDALRGIQRERGVTLVLVTHDARIADTADRTVYMLDGRIEDERTSAARAEPAEAPSTVV
jgi:putative ABC transport system ATP-binding protein